MQLEYTGQKAGIHLTFPWMRKAVMMVPKKGFEVDDDDALRLINDFPEIFREYQEDPLQQFIREQAEADAGRLKAEQAAQIGDGCSGGDDKYKDVTFETKDGAYLCPLCEKCYKENRGKGRAMLISHLEKDHTEKWAEMMAESAGDEPINQ